MVAQVRPRLEERRTKRFRLAQRRRANREAERVR